MRLADLTDGGEVDGVVEMAVAPLGEAMHGPFTRGELDGRSAVVGRLAIAVSEAADVSGVADHRAGVDGPDAEQVCETRALRSDRQADPAVGVGELGMEAADVGEELEGQVAIASAPRRSLDAAWPGTDLRQKR